MDIRVEYCQKQSLLPSVRLSLSEMLLSGGEDALDAREILSHYSDKELALLLRMGLTDWTGLRNKESLLEDINNTLSNIHSFGVIAVADLVSFKKINDTFGQTIGDEVINVTAKAIGETIRAINRNDPREATDEIYTCDSSSTTRIGGDEFAIYLKGGSKLANADHEEIIRSKLEAILKHKELFATIGQLGIIGFGIRAQVITVDPNAHSTPSEVLKLIGAKSAYSFEYQLLPNQAGELSVIKIK